MTDGMIIDPNKIDFGKYLQDTSFLEAQSIKSVGTFANDVAEFAETGNKANGATLPWGN